MIDEANRWLPPSPHKEAVLQMLRNGRAHIEERGHNNPPLLVFQDGGVLELPRVRVQENGKSFWQDSSETSVTRQTKHCDICGTLDELKQLLADEPELARREPGRVLRLVDDLEYMLSRLAKRRQSYEEFIAEVSASAEKTESIEMPDLSAAQAHASELRSAVEAGPDAVRQRLEELHARAERFRDVANASEQVIREHLSAAMTIGKLFEQIRGARNWDSDASG